MRLATKIYGEANAGRDIVLLHGTGARAEMWRRQIYPLVKAGYRCVVPDLRGHGESDEPGDTADLHVHLSDLIETVEEVGIARPAAFAGHSLGAILSIELAQRQPQAVRKILAVSMPAKVPAITAEAFRWFLGWPYKTMRSSGVHRNLDWRTRELIATNPHALHQILSNFAALDYVVETPQVSCPVHFATGRLDLVAPYVYVEQLHRAMPTSTLTVIEFAGHNPMDSQPRAFNDWFFSKLAD